MRLDPNDLVLFAHLVEEGNFTRTAERLNIPNSTLSRRISILESQLGERLLLRTTRKFVLTDFGRAVLAHAQQVTAEIEATTELTEHHHAEPRGRLRISMPGDFTSDMIGPLLAEFMSHYPAVTLDMDVSQDWVDLFRNNYDVALRMGELPDDASLAARRIAIFTMGLYASPGYLKQFGAPEEPSALMERATLHLRTRTGDSVAWKLQKDGVQWEGTPPGRAMANSPGVLKHLALAGTGIACLADHFVRPQVAIGELVRVLEGWSPPAIPVWAVFPGRRLMPSRTRAFIDFLERWSV